MCIRWGGGLRTPNLLVQGQARCQLRYSPKANRDWGRLRTGVLPAELPSRGDTQQNISAGRQLRQVPAKLREVDDERAPYNLEVNVLVVVDDSVARTGNCPPRYLGT